MPAKPIYWYEKPKTFIYFVQMDRIGPIKIGIAKDVGKRLIGLQTSNPYPLRLLSYYPSNLDHEKEWHSEFEYLRLEGEWFLPHPKLLKEIELNHISKESLCQPK